MDRITKADHHIGQLVHHRLFNYRGVVYDVDPVFMLPDEWYEQVALSRPPKDEPWYRVLVWLITADMVSRLSLLLLV